MPLIKAQFGTSEREALRKGVGQGQVKRILTRAGTEMVPAPFLARPFRISPISWKTISGLPRGTGVSGLPDLVALLDLVVGPGAAYPLHSAYKVAYLPSALGFQHAWNIEAVAAEARLSDTSGFTSG